MYDKFGQWTFSGGEPERVLTQDEMFDDITLYWGTNSAISSAQLYWQNNANNFNAVDISIPAAVTVFPGEIYRAPRSWAERSYHKLIYWNEVDKGGRRRVGAARTRQYRNPSSIQIAALAGKKDARIPTPDAATSIGPRRHNRAEAVIEADGSLIAAGRHRSLPYRQISSPCKRVVAFACRLENGTTRNAHDLG